jgi:hypothetical protein
MATDPAPPPVPPHAAEQMPGFEAFLLRVGTLNYTWTNTESLLIHLIAGLARIDKDTAVILYLTLNTTRARLDLVERLTKRDACPAPKAAQPRILAVAARMKSLSALRNRFNHCIYAFDADGGPPRAIQMRIADRRESIRVGAESILDSATLEEIDTALRELQKLNTEIWSIVADYGFPF